MRRVPPSFAGPMGIADLAGNFDPTKLGKEIDAAWN